MPPPELISSSVFICEHVLREADGVISAIRIVDLFSVADLPSNEHAENVPVVIQAYVCAILKFAPAFSGQHYIEPKFINAKGELSSLGKSMEFEARGNSIDGTPAGVNLAVQLNLTVKNFGLCYVCIYLDGEEIGRTPLMLRRQQPQETPGTTMKN